jgi:hypothetical protein
LSHSQRSAGKQAFFRGGGLHSFSLEVYVCHVPVRCGKCGETSRWPFAGERKRCVSPADDSTMCTGHAPNDRRKTSHFPPEIYFIESIHSSNGGIHILFHARCVPAMRGNLLLVLGGTLKIRRHLLLLVLLGILNVCQPTVRPHVSSNLLGEYLVSSIY